MFVLAAAAVAHSSIQSSEAVAVIAAIFLAAFWRFVLKLGIALMVVMVLVIVFGGASAVLHW